MGLDSGLGVEKALREYVEMLDIAFPHGLLSRLELRALADLLENLNVNVRSASKLGDLLDEACEVGNLHLRWEVDREGLVSKLRGCPPAECWAIIERLR
ncbi:MAG TPA: hypothetical protein VNL15_07110, partial [Dehalococcoidia bacterium]|nr:hypothetical protein [Dehalococcoidia bacterium]